VKLGAESNEKLVKLGAESTNKGKLSAPVFCKKITYTNNVILKLPAINKQTDEKRGRFNENPSPG